MWIVAYYEDVRWWEALLVGEDDAKCMIGNNGCTKINGEYANSLEAQVEADKLNGVGGDGTL